MLENNKFKDSRITPRICFTLMFFVLLYKKIVDGDYNFSEFDNRLIDILEEYDHYTYNFL